MDPLILGAKKSRLDTPFSCEQRGGFPRSLGELFLQKQPSGVPFSSPHSELLEPLISVSGTTCKLGTLFCA